MGYEAAKNTNNCITHLWLKPCHIRAFCKGKQTQCAIAVILYYC